MNNRKVDEATFMQGFLEYLQNYYGSAPSFNQDVTTYANLPKLPLFQSAPTPPQLSEAMGMEDTAYMGGMDQPLGEPTPMMGGGELGMALNGLMGGGRQQAAPQMMQGMDPTRLK